jgi:hypothetical protein
MSQRGVVDVFLYIFRMRGFAVRSWTYYQKTEHLHFCFSNAFQTRDEMQWCETMEMTPYVDLSGKQWVYLKLPSSFTPQTTAEAF